MEKFQQIIFKFSYSYFLRLQNSLSQQVSTEIMFIIFIKTYNFLKFFVSKGAKLSQAEKIHTADHVTSSTRSYHACNQLYKFISKYALNYVTES